MRLDELITVSNIDDYPKEPLDNPEDIIKMNIPFLIRMFEYVREEVKDDATLHKIVENIIGKRDKVLTMEDYESSIKLSDELSSIH